MESRLGEGEVVVVREGSPTKAAQPVHAHVVPKALYRSIEAAFEWLSPETSAVTAAGSGRWEGRPDLLNSARGGKASAGTSVLFLSNHTCGTGE